MLTAKSEEIDKVLGLELGADDYITKPFSLREFRSRVKAALRRAAMARRRAGDRRGAAGGPRAADRLRPSARSRVRGDEVPTTFVEFEILVALARAPGRVFTRDMLLTRIWGDSAYRDPRTIDVHIRHLREKLERDAKEPGVPVHGARRRLPLPRRGARSASRCCIALPNRLALLFFARSSSAAIGDRLPRRRPAARDAPARPEARRARWRARQHYERPPIRRRSTDRSGRRVARPPACGRREHDSATRASRCSASSATSAGPAALRASDSSDASRDPPTCSSASPTRPRAPAGSQRGDRGRRRPAASAEAARAAVAHRRRARSARASATSPSSPQPLADVARQRLADPPPDPRRRRARAAARAARRLPRRARRSPPRQAARARGRARSRRATSPRASTSTPATSSASSRARSTRCSASSPSSTTARKQFIATASHELRTPIFSLGGFLELLEDEELDEETRAPVPAPGARAGRPPAASSRPICSTSRGWRPARSSCAPSRPTSASCAATVAARVHARRSPRTSRTSSCA